MRARVTLLALVASLVAVPLAMSSAQAPFTPRVFAGTWTGTWSNVTFGSSGPAFIKGTVVGRGLAAKLKFRSDFGGNVFGCADPPADAVVLTHGRGANHWNAAGFAVKGHSKAFGDTVLAYRHATRSITGSGGKPRCNPGLTWRVSGKFAGKVFTGTVNITFQDGSTALSKLRLIKR